jgi:hypothetical protein
MRGQLKVLRQLCAVIGAMVLLGAPHCAFAYSLLTHEQLIDLTWQSSIAPLIRSRYPNISPADLERARAYAYGGCVIQDIGYYPFGDAFFSDLTHYVRTGDFVVNLFRNAQDADELAFAVGALSHYVGDSIGHAEATNRAVPVEFPKLRAKYGPIVTYGEGKHAHVQTEFAFDINEIAHHRLAPVHYLRHVGLLVPTRQVAAAFYQTYGLSEDFTEARTSRINVRGYRFAVHDLLPRIAYAVTLLNRRKMPPDVNTPEFNKLQAEVTRVEAENNWSAYRKKAGVGTYSLAVLIYILPKIGPLKMLAIKGPTPGTEDEYVRSVDRSVDLLNGVLQRFGAPRQSLPNKDLDTGAPTIRGTYALTDDTYAKLVKRLTADPAHSIPPGLKQDVLAFYKDAGANVPPEKKAAWERLQKQLAILSKMSVSNEPIAAQTE